ncbi:MAG: histidine kinase [Ferruginibacter sp.]
MLPAKKRYPFLTVLWIVATFNIFFTLFTIFVLIILQTPEGKTALKEIATVQNNIKTLASIIFQSAFYYYSLNYYNKLIVEKRNALPYLIFTSVLLVVVFCYYLLAANILPQRISTTKTPRAVLIFAFGLSAVFYVCISLLLAYLNNLRDEKKHRKVLEAQKMQLEVDKSQANFKFLKSQINPHFLHNTLNFLYAKSLPYSAELSEGILTLSDIMRYALNEATGSDDKAPLKDEIEHVRNVIKINQLRFSNNLQVMFEVNGVVNGIEIIPFLLITMVENAFKHGDLQRTDHPIKIRLTIEHSRLVFYCHNKKKTGPKEISTGLGLDNIRNRLDFAYGKNYKLHIRDDAEFYTTELTINEI